MPEVLGTDPGKGIMGKGATLQGAVTGVLGMITKIGIEGLEADAIDITTMNATGNWKLFIAGLKDAKSITIDLLYQATNENVVLATAAARVGAANEAWTVKFPDLCTFVCDGFITKLGQQIPMGDKIASSLTIKLSGPPTFTVHSGVI